jgi:molybdate transport system permease protein
LTTMILLIVTTPLAWWMTRSHSLGKLLVETIVSLPLVLPPTVLGFYLLIFLNPTGPLGAFWFSLTGGTLVFNFSGLLVGSLVYSLPFVIRPILTSFESLDHGLLEAAATLKANPWDRFFTIALPLAKPGFISAIVLGFAHTLGEFGVVLMLGGNIPGETSTVSIAIYDTVEQMRYGDAHILSGILLVFSFILLLGLFASQRKRCRFLW